MKKIFVALLLLQSSLGWTQNMCFDVFKSGHTLKKSVFLAMDRYAKERVMKNEFALLDRNVPVLQHDNLNRTPVFKVYGSDTESVSVKSVTAAKKAFRQYEDDSRENTTHLVAQVLFEKDEKGLDNAWAVLISQQLIDTRGLKTLSPKAIYSVERNSSGEIMKLITNRFGDLIM